MLKLQSKTAVRWVSRGHELPQQLHVEAATKCTCKHMLPMTLAHKNQEWRLVCWLRSCVCSRAVLRRYLGKIVQEDDAIG